MMAVTICAVVTMAATKLKDGHFDMVTADTVIAEYVAVTNHAGEYVVSFGVNDDGGGLVRTYSAKGKNLVMLNSAADHGTITTYQPNGKMLVDLTANPNGGVGAVYNKTGERIVSMSADEYGNGVVGAYNRKGRGRTLKPGPMIKEATNGC